MSLFHKVQQGGTSLFNKFTQNVPSIFRKVDNSVLRANSFLAPTLRHFGFDNMANVSNGLANTAHATRTAINNNLEKAVHAPVSELRRYA